MVVRMTSAASASLPPESLSKARRVLGGPRRASALRFFCYPLPPYLGGKVSRMSRLQGVSVCKYVILKGLLLNYSRQRTYAVFLSLCKKPRRFAGAFFISISSIAVGVELVRQLYFDCFHGVRGFWGLTGFWGGWICGGVEESNSVVPPFGLHSGLRQSGGALSRAALRPD